MNAFDTYLTQTAANLAKDPEHAPECEGSQAPDESATRCRICTCGFHPSVLNQRIAIGLLQARALECRELADNLRLSGVTLKSNLAAEFAQVLTSRSHMLEQKALVLCDQWPPSDGPVAETCDCGHTISQHSQREGIHGPCSACGCKGYFKRAAAEVVN